MKKRGFRRNPVEFGSAAAVAAAAIIPAAAAVVVAAVAAETAAAEQQNENDNNPKTIVTVSAEHKNDPFSAHVDFAVCAPVRLRWATRICVFGLVWIAPPAIYYARM